MATYVIMPTVANSARISSHRGACKLVCKNLTWFSWTQMHLHVDFGIGTCGFFQTPLGRTQADSCSRLQIWEPAMTGLMSNKLKKHGFFRSKYWVSHIWKTGFWDWKTQFFCQETQFFGDKPSFVLFCFFFSFFDRKTEFFEQKTGFFGRKSQFLCQKTGFFDRETRFFYQETRILYLLDINSAIACMLDGYVSSLFQESLCFPK